MTPAEAAALLTIAAAYDNRKPDADQARAWAMALDEYRFEDCRAAIVAHYQSSRAWMMPADVIDRVKRIRSARLLAYGVLPDPPASIDPDDTAALHRWRQDFTRQVADGQITAAEPNQHVIQTREEAAARLKELRAQVVRRTPEPERPALAELVAALPTPPPAAAVARDGEG